MAAGPIPDIVVSRLPRYLLTLERMQQAGIKLTSSRELGEKLGASDAQIRKDLSHFGEFGKQGTGYHIAYLVEQLRAILKVDRVWDIVLIGAGDLGHAIARYQGFNNRGFAIVMVFDNDPQKIGNRIGDFLVRDYAEMQSTVRQVGIQIAMLTVPAAVAQKVADDVIQAGVTAILNYAPVPLTVPPGVQVQYIDPINRLQHMTFYLK